MSNSLPKAYIRMAMTETPDNDPVPPQDPVATPAPRPPPPRPTPKEIGGPAGPEPTRFGDWERKGRVSDF
jgi:homeobox protein ESX1